MLADQYLNEAVHEFRRIKKLADDALAQVSTEYFFTTLDSESNSLALILKHLAGNMRSRWIDFLNSDGEKPDRNRDSEFVVEAADTRESIVKRWEAGWQCLFEALASLRQEDLDTIVFIRGEPQSVLKAIQRQLTHYAYHTGQIVFLAKHFAAEHWKSLSTPRGKSGEFNATIVKKWLGKTEAPSR